MATKREGKLLWICTLILVASAILLGVFTFRSPLVSAHGSIILHCEKEDKATRIYPCDEPVPGHEKGTEIPKECIQACEGAGGIPATFGKNSTQLYCAEALKDFKCGGTEISATPARESPNPIDATQLAETIKEKEAAAEKKCGKFLDVGCWVSTLLNAVLNIGATILDAVVGSIALVLKFFATLLQGALNQVIRYFVSIPVSPSNADAPEFVKKAWDFTRGFANNFFILILAFIGLATILRLESYQLKKTLPALLFVALLVNFSGVLVGLVADIGNIITTFFLTLAADPTWSTKDIPSFGGTNASAKLGVHIVEIIYYLISSLVYFLVMLVFALRTIALWTLSIVSPIAFALYILPATRRFFNDWWKQLIQWSFMGIPVAFFIFLASTVLQYGATPKGITAPGALADFLAPFTTLFLLFTGITMSMAMAPAAAQGAINLGTKLGIQGAMGFGSAVSRRMPLGKFGENIRKRGQGIEVAEADKTRLERMPGMGVLLGAISSNPEKALNQRRKNLRRIDELLEKGDATEEEKNELTQLQQTTEGPDAPTMEQLQENVTKQRLGMRTTIARWSARTVGGGLEIGGKELTMRVGDKDIREFQQGMKEVGDKDSLMVFNMVKEELLKKGFVNKNRILGLLNGVRERGDSDDIRDALDQGILDKKLIGETIKTGMRVGPPGFRPLLKSFYGHIFSDPQAYGFDVRLDEQGKVIAGIGKDAKFLGEQQKSLPSKFKPQDLQGDTSDPNHWKLDSKDPNIRKAAETFVNMILEYRDADFMGQMARRERKGERDTIMQYIGKEGPFAESGLGEEWLLEKAPAVLRYMTSTASRSAGVGFDMTTGEADVKIEITHSLNRIQDQAVREETKSIVKSIVRDIQGISNENVLAVANSLVQFESLRAPLVRLVAIQKTSQEIGRERRRGAPQTTISSLEQKIAQEVQAMKTQVAQAAGTSQNPTQLEDAWDRIEQTMQPRKP